MKVLRNIIVIFLIASLIVPKDVFFFVAHIPDLIKHFHHHNKHHKQINLLGFIAEHSSESNHKDSHPAHKNLPFSHQHNSDCSHFVTCLVFYHKEISKFHLPVLIQKKIATNSFFINSDYMQSIWQPPKIS